MSLTKHKTSLSPPIAVCAAPVLAGIVLAVVLLRRHKASVKGG